jgi:hypothetical protein
VLTVQTTRSSAYGEREKLIFRTSRLRGGRVRQRAHPRELEQAPPPRRDRGRDAPPCRHRRAHRPSTTRRRFLASAAEADGARAMRYGGAVGR